jgi:hypothetical protein
LTDDEPAQARAARRLPADATAEYWVPLTFVLKQSWVLRKSAAPRRLVMGVNACNRTTAGAGRRLKSSAR